MNGIAFWKEMDYFYEILVFGGKLVTRIIIMLLLYFLVIHVISIVVIMALNHCLVNKVIHCDEMIGRITIISSNELQKVKTK